MTYGNQYAGQLASGMEVYGADDEKIGHLVEAGPNYLLVEKGWLFIKDLYLPTSAVARVDADRVYLSYTKAEAEQMGRDQLPTEGDAWYGSTMAGTATGYATDRVADTTYGTTDRAGYGTDREVRAGEDISVPVVEEQLKAGVREREAGHARVVKDVRAEEQTLEVPVEREEVYVTERTVNRPATEADLSMRDREIDIPLKEQEVVTSKEAVVTGEVEVRKEVKRDTERVSDTVRREEVRVEGGDSDRVHVEGLTDAQRRRYDTLSTDDQRRYAGMSATERDAFDRDYDTRYTVSGQPTDTAYDRSGMAGDRYDTTKDEGILDRAKDKLRDASDDLHNR
jgi:uncharacterized protein (TIGR02271 family)